MKKYESRLPYLPLWQAQGPPCRGKFPALALMVTFVMSFCGTAAAAEPSRTISSGNYDYLIQDGTAAITKHTGDEDRITLPSEIEEKILEIIGSPATLDGVTVTLKTAAAVEDEDGFTYTLAGTLENNSDEGIMQVGCTFALIDENGEEFRSFEIVHDGEDTAIPPHGSIDFSHNSVTRGKQSVPAAVKIGVSSVKTETELPPENVPKTGEYLYQARGDEKLSNIKEEPPVELVFHVDQGGNGKTARIREGAALDKAVELFCGIQIGEVSDVFVTDNYNRIGFVWEDGSETCISLLLDKYEYTVHDTWHTCELEHLDEFWSYCAGYLEQDRYE